MGGGLGALGLASTLHAAGGAASASKGPHFAPKAKRVIHLFMNGGPFGPDFLDPKPLLTKYNGQRPAGSDLRTERPTGGLLASPYTYSQHGTSGLQVSELLPNLANYADDLCVLRSCHTDNPNHGPALLLMNNGTMTERVPSMGSWLSYGLGNDNENLPSYVVLCPGRPVRFSILWSSAFLPARHQGVYINHSNLDPSQMIPWLTNSRIEIPDQRRQLDLLQELNQVHLAERGGADVALNGRMQVYYGNGQPWDTHSNHDATTRKLAADIDRPIVALLGDLKQRGLLEDTLIVWGGEFGRTPVSENGNGRDHNPHGFLMWLAGGGAKGGTAYGQSDDFGFKAAEGRMHVNDVHATILHLLGIDHEHLTYRYAGRDFRLTNVAGKVPQAVLG